MIPYNTDHKERSRRLRREMTPQEVSIWKAVRRKQIHGMTFLRQKPLGQYIADFYCSRARLVIEIDGGQHWEPDLAEADRIRTEVLESMGLRVLRFSNSEVRRSLPAVLEQIHRVVGERLSDDAPAR